MKKILLTIMLLLAGQIGFASCEGQNCVAPYDLTSGFSRFVSKVTGQNFIAEKIGESLTKKAISKEITNGKINVNLKSFSTRDLKAGRFKSLEITGKDVIVDGIYISYFDTKTLCDFNYVVQDKNGDFIVKEDIPVYAKTIITEDNLNKTMNSADYNRMVNDINTLGGTLNLFQIVSTSVKLKNGKMFYIMKYALPFVRKPQEIVISADLCIHNGEIILANTELVNDNLSLDVHNFSKILNYINPLDFSAKILENKNARFNIQNVKVSNGEIFIDGQITVLKDKE